MQTTQAQPRKPQPQPVYLADLQPRYCVLTTLSWTDARTVHTICVNRETLDAKCTCPATRECRHIRKAIEAVIEWGYKIENGVDLVHPMEYAKLDDLTGGSMDALEDFADYCDELRADETSPEPQPQQKKCPACGDSLSKWLDTNEDYCWRCGTWR